ncbi:ABC transporter substrate-binding protein [Pedobacter gandavensis]|uniref:ABC transporter substrate-binding protein n=1 Tax=Pedobacter gandavensis TaxID=2679963 RepID=UPI002931EF8C|nr:ABC transporter substrate-binding protein [Pedobacter gandavensis]
MNKNIALLFIAGAMTLFFGCANPTKEDTGKKKAIIVTDALGHIIELDKPVERMVVLYEPALDALYMLNAGDKIVGIFNSIYNSDELYPFYAKLDDRIKQKTLAVPGNNGDGNIESIMMLNPDLVVMLASQEDLAQALRAVGVQVYTTKVEQHQEVFQTMHDLAKLTGTSERATELVSYVKEELTTMKNRADSVQTKKKVYFAWAHGRIFATAGRNSMMHFCLEAAGVENACTFELDQPNISPETLISWNPDMIVMWNDSPDEFYRRKELGDVSAIKNKEIYNLLPMFFYNPHTLKALSSAASIHNWAYPNPDVDVKKQVESIILKLYGGKGKSLIPLI